jgi:hypothetical protein
MTSHKHGRGEEEQYFAKVEDEKIKAQANEAAHARTAAQAEELRKAHWMRCPKCGNELVERRFRTVTVDQCGWCGGVYVDRAEFAAIAGREDGVLRAALNELLRPKS